MGKRSDSRKRDLTGLRAPTELPEEWQVARLSDVATIMMGQSPPSETYNSDGKGLPFLQGKAEFGDLYPTPVKWCTQPARVSPTGAILISVRAPVGNVNLAPFECCIGRGLAAIGAADDTDTNFLFYWLLFSKPNLEEQGSGTIFKSINRAVLENFPVVFPPLPEQRAIARVLSTLQRAIETQDKLITASRQVKKALMRHLFTYGAVPPAEAARVPLKETEIGAVPDGWRLNRVGDLATHVGSGVTPRGGAKTYLNLGIPLVRSQNVLMNQLSLADVAYISPETHKNMQRSAIKPGDVLLNITGASIGRVAVVPETLKEANVNQHVCAIRLIEEANPDFLAYYLATEKGQWQIMSTQIGTTRQGLNYQQVRGFQIPLPAYTEQRAIACILAAVDNKIAAEEKRKAALQTLFKTTLHQLMTGQVRIVTG